MFKAVIFDLDETVFNYERPQQKALEYISKKYFNDIDFFERYNKVKNIVQNRKSGHDKYFYFKELVELVDISNKYETLLNINKDYNKIFKNEISLINDIVPFLNFLKENSIRIIALSDNVSSLQIEKLEALGLLNYFEFCFTTDEINLNKSNPLLLKYVLDRIGLSSDEVVMIGNSYKDDIEPALVNNIFSFYFDVSIDDIIIRTDYISFNSYKILLGLLSDIYVNIDKLIEIGRFFGLREEIAPAGGGNISIKLKDHNLIIIKSSGYNLSEITRDQGFCIFIYNKLVQELHKCLDSSKDSKDSKDSDKNLDICYKNTRTFIKNKNNYPSIEVPFHAILNNNLVIHLHILQSFADKRDFSEYGSIKYVKPGLDILNFFKNYDQKFYFLENHGIIYQIDDYLSTRPFDILDLIYKELHIEMDLLNIISNQLINEIYGNENKKTIIGFRLMDYYHSLTFKEIKDKYPITPDHIVYCGPLMFLSSKETNGINIISRYFDEDEDIFDDERDMSFLKIILLYNQDERDEYVFFICSNINEMKKIESTFKQFLSLHVYDQKHIFTKLDQQEIDSLLNWSREEIRNKNTQALIFY